MDAVLYQEILETFLFPYCQQHFKLSDIVLHQDNDPKHTSRLCIDTLKSLGIKWIKAPAQSPDLNPIELLWHSMLEYVRNKFCKNCFQVKHAILEWEETISPEICRSYVNKIHEVINKVIQNKGGWSNF